MLEVNELMNRIHEAISRMELYGVKPDRVYINKRYEEPIRINLSPYVKGYKDMFDGLPVEFQKEMPYWLDFAVVPKTKKTNRDKLIELFGKEVFKNMMTAEWWDEEYEEE